MRYLAFAISALTSLASYPVGLEWVWPGVYQTMPTAMLAFVVGLTALGLWATPYLCRMDALSLRIALHRAGGNGLASYGICLFLLGFVPMIAFGMPPEGFFRVVLLAAPLMLCGAVAQLTYIAITGE